MNQQNLDNFASHVLRDLGGAFSIAPVRIGNRLGLYRALKEHGPQTSAQLARRLGLAERYVREWLAQQAASGYLHYAAKDRTFALPHEHALVLADEESAAYMVDAFDAAAAYLDNQAAVEVAFKTGEGVGWCEQSGCLACAVARFFRPGYHAHLVSTWLPSLSGVVEKLVRGARVADIGCGHGHSTLIMARAFPNSEFVGFDFDATSIAAARAHGAEHPELSNARFVVASATELPKEDYQLVTSFDCLHDMGDPVAVATRVHEALAPGGTWMIVEPFAHDRLEDNLNPVSRLYYSASTMVCVPCSLAQPGGAALGAQAGEARLREVVLAGGFPELRRSCETPFNMILEASKRAA